MWKPPSIEHYIRSTRSCTSLLFLPLSSTSSFQSLLAVYSLQSSANHGINHRFFKVNTSLENNSTRPPHCSSHSTNLQDVWYLRVHLLPYGEESG